MNFLRKLDEKKLERLMENNPDYFFDMLPHAIALGVDTKFALLRNLYTSESLLEYEDTSGDN